MTIKNKLVRSWVLVFSSVGFCKIDKHASETGDSCYLNNRTFISAVQREEEVCKLVPRFFW